MSAELLINITPHETRVSLVENGVLHEILIERANHRGLIGNIYNGRVCRVLPGMQAAFVDIGLQRAAFLHVSDIISENTKQWRQLPPEPDLPTLRKQERNNDSSRSQPDHSNARVFEPITDLLQEGQEILVQVKKDPIGSKSARLTTSLSIPSYYLVLMPGIHIIGISQRIEDQAERDRLQQVVQTLIHELPSIDQNGDSMKYLGLPPGYIVRTAAESTAAALLRADMQFLHRIWRSIQERLPTLSAPGIVYEDLPLVMRTLRDFSGPEIERVRIDSRPVLSKVQEFTDRFLPELTSRIEYYSGERPIFDIYGIEDEIEKALSRQVQLKSGGHLVFDQTEAMTTIDVNTGAYVGHRNLEETIFKTNLEAAQTLARQLRLRNLGGIIIIDFIDMESEEQKRQVLRILEKSLARDPVKTTISKVSALGLVQMTRKRTRESLEHVLCETCPMCRGGGSIKAVDTVCYEIFREIVRSSRQFDAERLLVLAAPEVIDKLVDDESDSFAELETLIGKPITLQKEDLYAREYFDVLY